MNPMASSPRTGVRHARAIQGRRRPGSSGTTSIAAKRSIRGPSVNATAPQSCAASRTRSTPRWSRKAGRNAAYPSSEYGQPAGLPDSPKPGRSTAIPPVRSRNGVQSSAESGTPCT